MFNLKAELGILRKAIIQSGVNIETFPYQRKPKEQNPSFAVKQNEKFAETAKKKNHGNNAMQHSLVQIWQVLHYTLWWAPRKTKYIDIG